MAMNRSDLVERFLALERDDAMPLLQALLEASPGPERAALIQAARLAIDTHEARLEQRYIDRRADAASVQD